MNKSIFAGLECRATVPELEIDVAEGTTWLVANKANNTLPILDLIKNMDEVIVDFLELGKILYSNVDQSNYQPLFYDDIIAERFLSASGFLAPSDVGDFNNPILDINSPFLKCNEEEVIAAIRRFFQKHGALYLRHLPGNAAYVLRAVAKGILGNKEYDTFRCIPINYLAYIIFELYFRYKNPENYAILRAKHKPKAKFVYGIPDPINWPVIINCNMNIRLSYRYDIGWQEKKVINSLIDAISLFLFYEDTRFVRECKYCKKIFVSDVKSAVYCSPACRNCANSKKSYDRKKALDNNGNHQKN